MSPNLPLVAYDRPLINQTGSFNMQGQIFSRVLFLQLIATLVLCHSLGCKKANPEGRENVNGTITLNGKAIDPKWTAAISFVPADGRGATEGGGGQINQGRYLLTGPDGVMPGKYRVKLFMNQYYDVKTGEPATENTGEFDSVHIGMIPREFNEDSTLEFEVVKGRKNVFDYDIVTDYAPDPASIPRTAKPKPVVQ